MDVNKVMGLLNTYMAEQVQLGKKRANALSSYKVICYKDEKNYM